MISVLEQFVLFYCFWYTSIFSLGVLVMYIVSSVYDIFFDDFTNLYGFFFFINKFISNILLDISLAFNISQKFMYFSIFTFNFTYIFNICTSIPFFYPLLSFLGISFFFTWTTFLSIILTTILEQKFDYFSIFTCTTVSHALLEVFATINIISYFIRFFSLTIRAFASSSASTILLGLFSNIVIFILFYNLSVEMTIFFYISFILVIIINFLEFFIPLLQAQIFNFLVYLYANELMLNYKVYLDFFNQKSKEEYFIYSLTIDQNFYW